MAGFQQLTVFRDLDFRGYAKHSQNIKGNPNTEKVIFVDHFGGKALDTSYIWNSAGESSGSVAHEAPHILVITSDSAADDEWSVATQLNYQGQYNPIFEVKLRCDDITGLGWNICFADAKVYSAYGVFDYPSGSLSSPATVAAGFNYTPDATTKNIYGVSINTSNGSIIDSGHTEANASWATYRLELIDNGAGDGTANAFYYLNTAGKEINHVTDFIGMEVDAVARTTALCLHISIMNQGSGADNVDVDYVKTWQDAQG